MVLSFLMQKRAQNRPVRDRGVGYVPRGSVLFPHLTVLDNLLLHGQARAEGVRRAREALAELGCRVWNTQHQPASLSGGETQRIALIRAFMRQPRVWFWMNRWLHRMYLHEYPFESSLFSASVNWISRCFLSPMMFGSSLATGACACFRPRSGGR